MRLKCLIIWIVAVILYTIISVYLFQSYSKTNKKYKILPPPQKLILLVSQPRSGSTYLSNIISKAFKSIFFYEPLYQIDRLLRVDSNFVSEERRGDYDMASTTYLQNIFKCQFHEKKEWMQILASPFHYHNKLKGGECAQNDVLKKRNNMKAVWREGYRLDRCMPYFNPKHLQDDCQKFNLMVKLLETRIPNVNVKRLESFIDKRTAYKIIYLIRDPRAAFWSLLKTGWLTTSAKSSTFRRYVQLRCNEMYKNILAVKKAKHYVIVRFEDIMAKPEHALTDIYEFVDDEVAQRIYAQLRLNYCYVPQFNNWYNKTLSRSKRSADNEELDANEKTGGVAASEEENKSMKENTEDGDVTDEDIDEKHKKNYECFSINKWRYAVSKDFVEFIEGKCSKVMVLMGYREVRDRHELIKNIKEPLVVEPML